MPNDPQPNNDEFDGLDSAPEDALGSAPEDVRPKSNLNKNQKLAVSGLAVFAVLVIVLWSVQLKNNIYGPLNGNSSGSSQTQAETQAASDLALKNKDTDADGLFDYDELNIYRTSPYLEDSDSDSLKDGLEVKNGTDPNCPQGRTCLSSSAADQGALPAAGSDTLNNLLNQYNAVKPEPDQPAAPAGGSAADLTAEQKQALKGIDAASLRRLLLESGMDKAALDKIGDAELMQSYNETLQ